ncbi:hypothetical protein CsatB_020276 [Cannabis sativa]
MAKTRARQGKLKSELKKPSKRGPTSTADVCKTRTKDSIIGVKPIEFSNAENDGDKEQNMEQNTQDVDLFQAPISLRSSLQAIKRKMK